MSQQPKHKLHQRQSTPVIHVYHGRRGAVAPFFDVRDKHESRITITQHNNT